jgi:hypothetical protein
MNTNRSDKKLVGEQYEYMGKGDSGMKSIIERMFNFSFNEWVMYLLQFNRGNILGIMVTWDTEFLLACH